VKGDGPAAAPPDATDRRLAYALLLTTPVLFAANMLAARWVQGAIPAVGMATWRWSLTFLLLLPLAARDLWAGRDELRRDWPTLLLLGALGMGLCGAPVYVGAQTTTATNIGLLYATSPIFILIFGRIGWGVPIGGLQVVGIALCLVGGLVVLARGDFATLLGLEFVVGDLWIGAAVLAWSLYSVLLRYRPSSLAVLPRLAAIVLGGVVANLPFYALEIATGHPTPLTLHTLSVFLFLAIVPGVGAYLAYGKLVDLVGPARTGLLLYLIPLYNVGLAWILLGERPYPFHAVGMVLTLTGVWLGTRVPKQTAG